MSTRKDVEYSECLCVLQYESIKLAVSTTVVLQNRILDAQVALTFRRYRSLRFAQDFSVLLLFTLIRKWIFTHIQMACRVQVKWHGIWDETKLSAFSNALHYLMAVN